MVSYHNGDLLKSDCSIIAHQVNTYGIMGDGIAFQIAERYHYVNEEYKRYCECCNYNYEKLIYNVLFCRGWDGKIIANCFTQREMTTDTEALKTVVKIIKTYAKSQKLKTIGIPYKYGCGIAKGNWEEVRGIWEKEFCDNDIDLQIWRNEVLNGKRDN